jgi:hypothetical protein
LAENIAGKDETSAIAYVVKTPNVDEKAYINPEKFKSLNSMPEIIRDDLEDLMEKKNYIPPYVIQPLQNIKITEGDNIVLKCLIDGNPKPKV